MLTLSYLLDPTFELVNTSGKPLSNGYIEVYIHGTREKYYCYSDFDGTIHPFKIPLDSLGSNIILAESDKVYDVYVYNAFGKLVMSRYNVSPATSGVSPSPTPTIPTSVTSNDGSVVVIKDESNYDISILDTVNTINQNIANVEKEIEHQVTIIPNSSVYSDCILNSVLDYDGEIYQLSKLDADVAEYTLVEGDLIHVWSVTSDDLWNYTTYPLSDVTKQYVDERDTYLQNQIDSKKNTQTPVTAIGSSNKTITRIEQDNNGVISVVFNDIELPSQVPNVDIISSTLNITTEIDESTNTKTFTIDTMNGKVNYWTGYSGTCNTTKSSSVWSGTFKGYTSQTSNGEWDVDNNVTGGIKLLKDHVYVALAEIRVYNAFNLTDKLYSCRLWTTGGKGVDLNYDFTFDGTFQHYETHSVNKLWTPTADTYAYFNFKYEDEGDDDVAKVYAYISSLNIVDITSAIGSSSSSGGKEYTAGDAIDITNDTINVKYSKGLEVTSDNELQVKLGKGLTFNTEAGVEGELMVDEEVKDVVETVEKLKDDLDTQISTNFDMPNISGVYDFADRSVTTMGNGDCMLYQGFIIPINNEIRSEAESTDNEPPTLLGIYAKQNFDKKIMIALYQYDIYEGTTYVGDTGPVTVNEGRNEYVLKNKNDLIHEIASDKVYYASLFIPSTSNVNGLLLAGCPGYDQNINSRPRLTCVSENIKYNNENLDMDNPATTLNLYTENAEGYRNYFIGPWNDGYNERPSAPRFFMTIRNGFATAPIDPPTPPSTDNPFDNIDSYTLKSSNINELFGVNATDTSIIVREVKPFNDVTIKSWTVYDDNPIEDYRFGADVFDSTWNKVASRDENITVEELGQQSDGTYGHKYTHPTGINLLTDNVYWFTGMTVYGTTPTTFKVYDTPDVQGSLYLISSGWYHDSSSRYNVKSQLTRLTLEDIDGNVYNI